MHSRGVIEGGVRDRRNMCQVVGGGRVTCRGLAERYCERAVQVMYKRPDLDQLVRARLAGTRLELAKYCIPISHLDSYLFDPPTISKPQPETYILHPLPRHIRNEGHHHHRLVLLGDPIFRQPGPRAGMQV